MVSRFSTRSSFYQGRLGALSIYAVGTLNLPYPSRLLSCVLETYTLHGQINPIPALFMFKNHFGYADKQEMVITPNQPLGEQVSTEELQKKYLEDVTGIATDDETEE